LSIWYLHPARLLKSLNLADQEALKEAGRLKRWGHRALISREIAADTVSIVLKGAVDWEDPSHKLRLLGGDLFGETGGATLGTLRAYDDALICEVPRADFLDITGDKLPGRSTLFRLKGTRFELDALPLLFTRPEERISWAMTQMAERYGTINGTSATLPNLKERHFSELTGLSMAQTRGILKSWRDAKWIESGRMELVIPDLQLILDINESKL